MKYYKNKITENIHGDRLLVGFSSRKISSTQDTLDVA